MTKRKNKGNWWRINFVWINKLEFLIEDELFTFGINSKLNLGIQNDVFPYIVFY